MNEQAVPHTVIVFDTAMSSSGALHRQVHLDKGLDQVIRAALSRCPFVDDTWFHRVDGDSAVLAAPAGAPKDKIAADLVRELVIALKNFNRTMNETGRLRVRVAINHGDVVIHGDGTKGKHINGRPLTKAARLRDSEALRDALRRNEHADMVLVLTDSFYDDAVVDGNRALDPHAFDFVHDKVKDLEVSGWIWVPDAERESPVRPAPATADAPSGSRSTPVTAPHNAPGGNHTTIGSVDVTGGAAIGTNAHNSHRQ
jgi:hypothetical protein